MYVIQPQPWKSVYLPRSKKGTERSCIIMGGSNCCVGSRGPGSGAFVPHGLFIGHHDQRYRHAHGPGLGRPDAGELHI